MAQNEEEIPYVFKILLLGDGGVGKTSLLRRFIDNTFDPDYQSTIGVQFMTKLVKFENKVVKLVIWDIAGQTKFTTFRHLYYKDANGIILVYDITRRDSVEHLPRWLGDAIKSCGADIKTAVLGNKSDLINRRAVDHGIGEHFAKEIQAELYCETSAKSGDNVEKAFLAIAKALVKRSEKLQFNPEG